MTEEHLDALAAELDRRLAAADRDLRRRYPGDAPGRQPVHTVYVPADRYSPNLAEEWGRVASEVLALHAASPVDLAAATALPLPLVQDVYDRVVAKLRREPIEDVRIDFEDGYGVRPDEEEDDAARSAAKVLSAATQTASGTPFCGIRMKSLEAPTRRRALRTLDLVVGTLTATGGLPSGFVVTLPKVTSVDQVHGMVTTCERLEQAHGLAAGALRFELQIETPQAVVAADGSAPVARMIHESAGRCAGLHFGTYDYTAACGILAAHQSLEHPAADHAKAVMQAAAAGTGVRISDGSTNVLPVGDGNGVRAAWRLHARLVRRSLERGFYQGWDLHPTQLPSRYTAVFAFYREGLSEAAPRLRAYVAQTESAVLDEPATARALAQTVVRAIDCGAAEPAEVAELTGLDQARLAALAHPRPEVGT